MAKPQRRTAATASTSARSVSTSTGRRTPVRGGPISPFPASPVPDAANTPGNHPTFTDAVALYEQAIRQIHDRDFTGAAERLRRVLAAFPEERALAERARVYLARCESQIRPAAAEPQSLAEHLYAATLALNAGQAERAIGYLDAALRLDPGNDRALYMLATAHAERGNVEVAIPYLRQAIESNPDNRALARFDPDLAGLRAEDTIAALLDSPLPQRHGDRNSSIHPRSAN